MSINAEPLPIRESDEFIARMVDDADLPALLIALAHATGDFALLRDEFRPPLKASPTGAEPQGGMSPEIQAKAKAAAIKAIKRYRDAGCPPPQHLTDDEFRSLLAFIAGDAADDYRSLAMHELNIMGDVSAPEWTKDELDPDRDFRVAIVGAGLSGLVMAYRLAQAGVSVVIFEKNPEVGGTWWDNKYPGCRLDTSNFAYSFAFAQKNDWPYQYSPQSTILEYLCDVSSAYDLRKLIRFETEVEMMEFDEDDKKWTLTVRPTGQPTTKLRFDVAILAVGQLSRPIIPDFPGASQFKGHIFHSARWRDDVALDGKNVAVIGTGASAFQIIPAIAEQVSNLFVYQRTPAWMLPAPNYYKPLPEGLAWLFLHLPFYSNWYRFYQFWTSSESRLRFFEVDEKWPRKDSVSEANEQLRKVLYDHMVPQYADRPDLLEKVVPAYPPGAKRMLRDNGVWAETLKRENVELVTESIEMFTAEGIRTSDQKERPIDVVVLATGFSASEFYVPIKIIGRDQVDLHEFWQGDARAGLGGCMPKFPNLFSVFGPNAALVVNGSIFFMSECCANYILECIHALLARRHRTMEIKPDVFETFVAEVDAANRRLAWGAVSSVSSWYRNKFGRSGQVWPFTLGEFWNRTRQPDLGSFHMQ
jgi:4-hydroxyacetophenone monooxygenase